MLVALNNHINIIMITTPFILHSLFFFTIHLLFSSTFALNLDGLTLLSIKHSLVSNQSSLLQNWNQSDLTPCSWFGVTCTPKTGPVTGLSLPNSQLSGPIPIGLARLRHIRVLDLSNNFINGTLPFGFNGANLNYLNLSHNKISGSVFPGFAQQIPETAVVDLSFNNFAGEIPRTLSNQKPECFTGNLDLCGKPLLKTCIVPSSHSLPPNVTLGYPASAAIAAIPKSVDESNNKNNIRSVPKVNSWKIVAIVVGDAAAVLVLIVIFFHAYQFRKKKTTKEFIGSSGLDESRASCFCFSFRGATEAEPETEAPKPACFCFRGAAETEASASPVTACFCFRIPGTDASETATDSESVDINNINKTSCLVMVDGETKMDMDTLLKSSAYILGSSGGSIVYKIVVAGDMALAVRRLADCGVERMKEFEKIVRGLSKLRHRNLVKIKGFYWGEEEKLVLYDYVSGGSLAGVAHEKVGPSSCHLSFDLRLKIAKGIAKGLSYIHEKKHVHGNVKPNNILLTPEMEPVISDFGIEWLMSGKTNYAFDKSTLNFGSKRSTSSLGETIISRGHYHYHYHNHYQAPESMKILKSNPKWDVYSFGIILLELFSGKVLSDKELALWNTGSIVDDMETKILRITDQLIATLDVHGRDNSLLTCFKLGFSCASLVPHKRPSMKEALQELEKIPCPS